MNRIILVILFLLVFSAREGMAQEFSVSNLEGTEITLELKRNDTLICSGIFNIKKKYDSLCVAEMRDLDDIGSVVTYEIAAAVLFPNGNLRTIRFFKTGFDELQPSAGCFPGISRKSEDPSDMEVYFESACG